jgi:hypothetical protein
MTGFKCPSVAFFAAASLAGMIVAFAVGQAPAQTVNPVPPMSPTLNPSNPGTIPQTPETPVSPSAPRGLSGSSSAPGSVVVAPPASVNRETTKTSAKPSPSPAHARRHASVRAHRSRHYGRVPAVRVVGPSYYPGLGEFYPPYVNPCHFRPYWGYDPGFMTYTCS